MAQRAEHFFMTAEQLPPDEVQNRAQELMGQIPSKEDPHLEYFVRPDLQLLKEAAKRGIKVVRIEIVYGCENYCIFCYPNPPRQMRFMPYPMILSIAESVQEVGVMAAINFDRSEPLQYRDTVFGVNLADVVKSNDKLSLYFSSTHGWPEGEKYAQAAAERLSKQGKTFRSMSLHLFHEEFLTPEVPAETFDKYTRQFIRAIMLLRPKTIGLRGLWGVGAPRGLEHLSLDFAAKLFMESILPHLPAELQARYRETFGIERREIRSVREGYDRVFPGNMDRNSPAGIHDGMFSRESIFYGYSEMIVNVDGHYKLGIRGAGDSRIEKGMLFG